jgi:hypothetical protein
MAMAKNSENRQLSGQPMPMAAPPTLPMPWPKEFSPPETMQMIEKEMAKFWKVRIRRDNSWA